MLTIIIMPVLLSLIKIPNEVHIRRLIRGGGGRINDEVVTDEQALVTLAHVNADGVIKVSAGRKRHALIRPSSPSFPRA